MSRTYHWLLKPSRSHLRVSVVAWVMASMACFALPSLRLALGALACLYALRRAFFLRATTNRVSQISYIAPNWYIFDQDGSRSEALSMTFGGLKCSFFVRFSFKPRHMYGLSWQQRLKWLFFGRRLVVFRDQLSERDWCLLCQSVYSQGCTLQ